MVRIPTHPGEMLLEEFLTPMELTQRDLAEAIHVPYQRVNELVNQKCGVTPSTALRLAKFFGMSLRIPVKSGRGRLPRPGHADRVRGRKAGRET